MLPINTVNTFNTLNTINTINTGDTVNTVYTSEPSTSSGQFFSIFSNAPSTIHSFGILTHLGPFCIILEHPEPFQTILDQFLTFPDSS